MMDQPHRPQHGRKPISERRREREVLLYSAAFRNFRRLEEPGPDFPPRGHVPHLSSDATLTALAQLTAIRLGAQRAMISLIDGQWQHILAEALPTTSLRPEAPGDASSKLWLGSTSLPRTYGICEQCLNVATVSSEDVAAFQFNPILGNQKYFYAGVPLRTPSGAVVGALCIFDDGARHTFQREHLVIFQSLATTIIEYLHTYTVKDQYRRGEQLTRGLVSFSEGASALLPFNVYQEDVEDWPAGVSSKEETDHSTGAETVSTKRLSRDSRNHPLQSSASAKSNRTMPSQNKSLNTLQETILPTNSKSMFARAANVLMASSSLDGVMFLDASVAASGRRQHLDGTEQRSESGISGLESAGESVGSEYSANEEPSLLYTYNTQTPSTASKTCQVLGFATTGGSDAVRLGVDSHPGMLLESDLARLLQEFPDGKIFAFTAEGLYMSSTDESLSSSSSLDSLDIDGDTEHSGSDFRTRRKNPGSRKQRCSKAIEGMFPGVRSVAFVPFWDYERSRWFAGCLCWSYNEDRLLSASVDLPYFKIFSHSIMRELSRLDALALSQSKTTFVASISHELRSPLHGILGTLEFIKDTPLDSFQTNMLNSLSACSQTLLDTINHVMDYAKIGEAKKHVSSKKLINSNTVRLSSKPLRTRRPKDAAFDLGIATEEVIEAVFSASSYVFVSSVRDLVVSPTKSASPDHTRTAFFSSSPKRETRFIVLDIGYEDDWFYCFPIASWKRIVMNIFGNAVKYTESGYINISLHASDSTKGTGSSKTVTLTVTDSGSGMSSPFLANRAFQPFSQENPHASGTGLGLSIVRQILETNGGKVEISSDPAVGTKLTVQLALTRSEKAQAFSTQHAEYLDWLPRLKGRRICILDQNLEEKSYQVDLEQYTEGSDRFTNALAITLANHLKMDVVRAKHWAEHDAEIVICPKPSFDYLSTIRRSRDANQRAPMTIFVAMDALEAATLRSDARITNKESVVEIITQPCGPYKLAYMLNKCLDRFECSEENLPHINSPFVLPQMNSGSGNETLDSIAFLSLSPVIGPSDAAASAAKPTVINNTTPFPLPEELGVPRIMVVDDNAINRKLLKAFMRKRGLQYAEFENGLEALHAYQGSTSKFDIVLMDMSMPVMDGMTATRSIRQHEHDLDLEPCCIIALTGLASASAKLEAWSSGINHFMTKPINFKELEELLRKERQKREKKPSPDCYDVTTDADNEADPA